MKCVFKAKVGWGKAATTKTMQHGEKVADLVLRRGFGAAGSNADKPLLQIGATTRPTRTLLQDHRRRTDQVWECCLGESLPMLTG